MTQKKTLKIDSKTDRQVKLNKGYKSIPPEYKEIPPARVFRDFWANARLHKRPIFLMIAFMMIQGGIVSGSIWMVKTSLDLFFEAKDSSSVFFLIGALFLATVGKSTVEFFFNWKRALITGKIRDDLVVRAFRNLVYNPFHVHIHEHDRKKYGWVLADASNHVSSVFGMFNSWVKQPFMVVSTIGALMVIAPLFTAVGVALIPLCAPLLKFFRRRIKEFIAQRQHLIGLLEEVVSESIRGIRIVKVFGLEEKEIRRVKKAVDKQRGLTTRNAFYTGLFSPLSELIGLTGLTVIIVMGRHYIHSGSFTTGTFFVFILSFINIYRPLKDISAGMLNYHMALDTGRRLAILSRNAEKERRARGTVHMDDFQELRIENLWFSYSPAPDKEEQYVLRGINLAIKKGETVALTGATGAGKSTLCDLLFRLYQVDKGNILVNGIPMSHLHPACFISKFSLCSQETIVFNNTLLEDIRIARPDATREDVMAVAKAVGLSSFMNSLDRGLDTWIGDRGVQCSGGQRQMIALARAILQKPEVLVLDEAISGIDMEAGQAVWQNIRKLLPDCTIIMISHHLHIIRLCDRFMVLKEGQIIRDSAMHEMEDPAAFFREFDRPGEGAGNP
jgi:ABC-type multidrug transport system fused ATPase/permease subunit